MSTHLTLATKVTIVRILGVPFFGLLVSLVSTMVTVLTSWRQYLGAGLSQMHSHDEEEEKEAA